MATTKQKVLKLAKRMGVKINIHCETPLETEAVAPEGHHWAAEDSCNGWDTGTHVLCADQLAGDTKENVWSDLLTRMDQALAKCPAGCFAWLPR